ncbi:FxSxx-COOH system tetratricopeptide repeat protein [Streptomyces sp. NPDC048751]|uniref:FxSxx-COOH system tetratricopeptide repeat protein n=1 Tax=Streptomyces sp. NPDC048751 TaxID=3365591 RepID=UPI003719F5FB
MTHPPDRPSEGRIITFHSPQGGTGRTMALANVAWIIASQGHRVLTADWNLEAPGLDRFLHPFLDRGALRRRPGVLELVLGHVARVEEARARLPEPGGLPQDPGEMDRLDAWVAAHTGIEDAVSPLQVDFPAGGRLDHLHARTADNEWARAYSTPDWDRFYDERFGGRFLDALCALFRRDYDYVLVDSPKGGSDLADLCTIQLPDVLVHCFTHSDQGIEGAAALSHRVESLYTHRRIRVLPVPMRAERAEPDRLEAARARVRLRFHGFLLRTPDVDPRRYWGDVEIPYQPAYAYEEILAVLRDEPGAPSSLLAAYERLTAVITRGEVTSLVPPDEGQRRTYLKTAVRGRSVDPPDVVLGHLPEDDVWADWIGGVLGEAGLTVVRPGPEDAGIQDLVRVASRTVVVVSAAYGDSALARTLWEAVVAVDELGSGRILVPVRVDPVPLACQFPDRAAVDLTGDDEADARTALLRAMKLRDVSRAGPGAAADSGPRYPGVEPPAWSVPMRNRGFTGRTELLRTLRRRLDGNDTPLVLHGPGGVGKTQLALEYAHRYGRGYDVVWWIHAESRAGALEQYAELAPHLGVEERGDAAATAEAVRDALRHDGRYRRWLLIFDSATTPETLEPMLVDSSVGHVLITTQHHGWARLAEHLDVGGFTRTESIAHLRGRVSELSAEDADAVAEEVADLPLAVELAAAFLEQSRMDPSLYLRLLREKPGRDDAGTDADPSWRGGALPDSLPQWPVARRLLQLCAHFGPEAIPLDLLNGKAVRDALAELEPGSDDTALVARAVRCLGRQPLCHVDRRNGTIQIHRLLQRVVREWMSEEEHETVRATVRAVLGGARPADGDRAADGAPGPG